MLIQVDIILLNLPEIIAQIYESPKVKGKAIEFD
jgi:hypothetical protein